MIRISICAAIAAFVAGAAMAQAPQPAPDPAASDPAALGWMQGSPPAADKTIRYIDGSFYKFPQTRWSFAHWNQFMPSTDIPRGDGKVFQLPRAERKDIAALSFQPANGGSAITWEQALAANYTDAVVVLHKGRIVYEKYFGVMTPQTRHIAWSVTKSFFGTLAETLVSEGKLDANAKVTQYIPELKDSGFGDVTVRQVMDMTTGIKFSENYADPNAEIWGYVRAGSVLPRPPGYAGPQNFYDFAKTVQKDPETQSNFRYQTVNTDVMGWLIRRVTNKSVGDLLSERIWSRMGMERDAMMVVDPSGNEFAGGGLLLTTRDMARFGEMMRKDGQFNGQAILPKAVIDSIRQGGDRAGFARAGYTTLPGWSYRDMWWVSHDDHGVFAARGVHGQTIYIDPKAQMVVARFASAPVAANGASDPAMLPAFRKLADHLMGADQ
ncbi:serine hydrolase [Variovorax sp. J22R133]|uniref:serine hydrolase domain-containing protein n=1 Tax=Variovorax brevis TaxID=3053503 RepID=UPI002576A7B0|nr:serine hydrolase [Variovorax sp. J22R133]MDM0110611.1 serine hydrolase [Variovorax sp. J22R133]